MRTMLYLLYSIYFVRRESVVLRTVRFINARGVHKFEATASNEDDVRVLRTILSTIFENHRLDDFPLGITPRSSVLFLHLFSGQIYEK